MHMGHRRHIGFGIGSEDQNLKVSLIPYYMHDLGHFTC